MQYENDWHIYWRWPDGVGFQGKASGKGWVVIKV